MSAAQEGHGSDGPDGIVGAVVLGVAFVLVGVLFFASLVVDSIVLFAGFLGLMLVVMLVSLVVTFRHDGVLTAENKLIAGFVLAAMVLLVSLSTFTSLPFEYIFGIVCIVGVIIPGLVLEYTSYGRDD